MRFVGIDPSTKTGFVALGADGEVLRRKELYGVGGEDPKRMIFLIDEIMAHLQPGDMICIEGFANGAKGSYVGQMFGIGWGIRMALMRRGWKYTEVSPGQLKKFATGKGNAAKEDMILPLSKNWGFENGSDNIRDGFVLAQIARGLQKMSEVDELLNEFYQYQLEVLNTIKNPTIKAKKSKKKVKA
jgi:crossover junction endodeoxyribonuclease RuvC